MRSGAAFLGFLVAAAIGFAVGYSAGRNASSPKREEPPKPSNVPGAGSKLERVPLENSPARGAPDALVTIVEFSELGCPFCARASALLKGLEARYGNDLRFVWKTTGRSTRAEIALATEVALAAAEQEKFWPLYAKIATAPDLDETKLRAAAAELGLDVEALLASGVGRTRVAADRALAERLEIAEMPAWFINGERVVAFESAGSLEKMIEAAKVRAQTLLASGVPSARVYELLQGNASERPPQRRDVRPPPPSDARQELARAKDAPQKGAYDPRVTIVEFSDFTSTYCARANAALEKVLEEYPNDVAIQFRFAPGPQNDRAATAARAAISAHLQGAFWRYHDRLFADPNALDDAALSKTAEALHLDVLRFERDRRLSAADAMLERDRQEALRVGVRGTPTFFVNGLPIRGVPTYADLKMTIDKELARTPAAAIAPTPKLDTTRSPRRGPREAKVEVVVFNDFECPVCRHLPPLVERLLAEHPGEVAVVYKQYPLPNHAMAELASVAALAAHRQDAFLKMHDRLFAHPEALAREDLIAHARVLGLDVDRFTRDLDDPEVRRAVKADIAEGVKLGVTGTPTLFIGAKRLDGLKTYEELEAAVAAALRSS